MDCLVNLTPKTKRGSCHKDVYGCITGKSISQLEDMLMHGVRGENQTFFIDFTGSNLKLKGLNYSLSIKLFMENRVVEYTIENAMSQDYPNSVVEFIVVNGIKRIEDSDEE